MAYGYYTDRTSTVVGGTIKGKTYGIYASGTVTIGNNDGEISTTSPDIAGGEYGLYGSSYNYYDGVLRGETAFQEGSISAIPDATTYHTESSAEYTENCTLTAAENYLEVAGVQYNSLSKAYDAITGDSGTIKVIKSTAVEAVLPASPAEKDITFDLNGYELTYTQPLINGGNMTIIDSSNEKTGKLSNPNTSSSTIINNSNLTLESGYIAGANQTINNTAGSSFTMNGGTIYCSRWRCMHNTGENNKLVNITLNSGLVKSDGGSSGNGVIYNNYYAILTLKSGSIIDVYTNRYGDTAISGGTVNIEGGTINVEKYGNESGGSATAVYARIVDFKSGTITVTNSTNDRSGSEPSSYGISGTTATMSGGEIIINASNGYPAYGLGSSTSTVTGGTITVNNTGSGNATGINSGKATVENVTINATSKNGAAYGVSASSNLDLSGGTITATSTGTGAAYGVYSKNDSSGSYIRKISGGTITAAANTGMAYGYYTDRTSTVVGGTIKGKTYGIYASGTVTIGNNEDEISTTSPDIAGGEFGLYGSSYNYYDGVLRGGNMAYPDGIVRDVPNSTVLHIEQQTIDGINYDTRWLTGEHVVAKIGNTEYTSLASAVNAANTSDIIDLVADSFVSSALEITSEKDITIQTNGYDIIIIGNPIINSGKTSIINNDYPNSSLVINYYYTSDYAITNNANATLTLTNVSFSTVNAIDNKGDLSLNNAQIESTNTAVRNTGNITANNNSIAGGTYTLYNDGGESIFNNTTFGSKSIYNKSGKLTLRNGTAEIIDNNILDFITNNGELTLDNFSATLTNNDLEISGGDGHYSRTIYNNGILTTQNNTVIKYILDAPSKRAYEYPVVLYNDGGTVTATNTSFIADGRNITSNSYSTIGIYSPTGTVTLKTGSIESYGITKAYGIFTNTGTITLGIPEQPGPTYGKEDADVSTTNPDIKAIGSSSGIGIKNASGGKVYFYDGRITGSSSAMPENPTATEYMFDPKDYLDENNYHYRILEWRREQPGN
ncbi:hypothetical protein IKG13_01530, partial [Candidatus Saccharibacteria bacterium]|nr:hypothetical protein [Candidatus Saccharibacteria bacterium]